MATGADQRLDLACCSYLAPAQLLGVSAWPQANGGAEVLRVEASVAADGPVVAALAAALGLRTGLAANPVACDPAGFRLRLHAFQPGYVDRPTTTAGPPPAASSTAATGTACRALTAASPTPPTPARPPPC